MKNLTARRAVAFLIDYFLFCFAFTLVGMVLLWGYFFFLDCNAKFDLGKRITRIVLLCHNQKFSRSMAIKHSALKVLAAMIWPVSFVYYFIRHKMIYDEYLGITIIGA